MERTVVRLGDVVVTLEADDLEGQRLLIPNSPEGKRLACLLIGKDDPAQEGEFFVVAHNEEVDSRLLSLVDGLTAVRWCHPTFTQLVLDLGKENL